ncbi:pentapeptide repeat-containing protein [Streptomyces specialis]|uniref:pentapeptide repeat-containing protein n=1 Tax=Streptomyces specialis TaxID=498367 RepID=UPI00073FA5A1|nr:pentapeptide repeat-containing protein [Streptomyces specialis]
MPYRNSAQLRRTAQRAARRGAGGRAGGGGGLDWARRIELASVVLASLVAAAGLWYSNVQVREQLVLTQQSHITDRYNAAVTNLGSEAVDVRLGGIYALQRIMQDSRRDHRTISNVLAAYIRTHTAPAGEGEQAEEAEEQEAAEAAEEDDTVLHGARADVNAALLVLAYRDTTEDDPYFTLDLRGATLSYTDFPYGNLARAFLYRADLSHAYFPLADLSGATLVDADLSDVDARGMYLAGADMQGAFLVRARLAGADLRGANLSEAQLAGADLRGADLTSAVVTPKQLVTALVDSTTTLPPDVAANPDVRRVIAGSGG